MKYLTLMLWLALCGPVCSQQLQLKGDGVTGWVAPDCTTADPDWIDAQPAVNRRLLPGDCSLAQDDPPVFSWAQAASRTGAYSLTVQRLGGDGAWQQALVGTTSVPRFFPTASLGAGQYRWWVSYVSVSSNHAAVIKSSVRRFDLDEGTSAVVLPTASVLQSNAAARAHPRVLPDGLSWDGVKAAATADPILQPVLTRLLSDANWFANVFNNGPAFVAEPALKTLADYGGNAGNYNVYLSDVENKALAAAYMVETLAYGFHLEPDAGRRAKQLAQAHDWTLQLARWSLDGSTSHTNQDQANRVIYLILARAYDLLWTELQPADKQEMLMAIRARLDLPVQNLSQFDALPYRSHEANTMYFTLRALLLTTEAPGDDAIVPPEWLATGWDAFTTIAHVWGETQGADANGTDYGWYNFGSIPETLYLLRTIAGADAAQRAYFRSAAAGLMAQSPPGSSGPGAFGDTNLNQAFASFAADLAGLHARVTGNPYAKWYAGLAPAVPADQMSRTHLLAAASRSVAACVAPDEFIFPDAGFVAFHTDMADPQRSSLMMRSSRFGAWNHSHADQNAIVFYSKGQPLLINGGVYDYYGSPHHVSVHRATRYKNAVTFDGGVGQAESDVSADPLQTMDARGNLVNAAVLGPLAIATGDAKLAYRRWHDTTKSWEPLVQTAFRSSAYHRSEGVVVLYDFMESATPRRWELNFHALADFVASGAEWKVTNGPGLACLMVLGPAGAFSSASGYAVPPATSSAPTQYHGVFAVTTPASVLRSVTIIRDQCSATPPRVDFSVTDPSGVSVVFGDGTQIDFSRALVTVH